MSKFRDLLSRRILATGTSMRNLVICFYIARYWFPGTSLPEAAGVSLAHGAYQCGIHFVREMGAAEVEYRVCVICRPSKFLSR